MSEQDAPGARPRRARAEPRGERPEAAHLHHRRHRAQCLRDRPRPAARLRRGDDGLLEKLDREELQGVLGHELSHVQNYDIRFSLLVGVLVGSASPCSPTCSRAAPSGAACPGAVAGSAAAAGPRRDHRRHRPRRRDPRAALRAAGPDGRQSAARVPRRCLERRADAQPLRPRAGAREDLLRPRSRSRSRTAPPSTCTSSTPSRSSMTSSMGLFSTHPAIVDRINRLRAPDRPAGARRRRRAGRSRASADRDRRDRG